MDADDLLGLLAIVVAVVVIGGIALVTIAGG